MQPMPNRPPLAATVLLYWPVRLPCRNRGTGDPGRLDLVESKTMILKWSQGYFSVWWSHADDSSTLNDRGVGSAPSRQGSLPD